MEHPDQETIQKFLTHCHRRHYAPKRTIICEGDRPDVLYYIIKGSVSVLIEDEEGHEMVLAYLNPGDYFGEMGLFDSSQQRSAWVRARTDCELAEIGYTKFRQISAQFPEILFALASQMAMRLRDTSRKAGNLAFLDVTGRVAGALLDLARQPDAITHPDGMQIRITRQELGRIVGCSREMVGRVLKDLELQGLITARGKTMVIHGTR